jgi:crotonobetainyl-CoA:carnitine CoA-transferase CaiB-like acyl-CoA transferase
MAGIFSGIRVIECSTYIAGPAAAAILSDFGADVIKIERPPYGDPYRHLTKLKGMPTCDENYCWILDDRNKRSVALDLADEQSRAALRKLIGEADIFITNYQPPLRRKFQLEYADLAALNPCLIYASVTGYGESGDDADKPGFDATAYWARSGLMFAVHNGDAEPVQSPPGFGDHPTSMTLFAGIVMALYRRQLTGRGANVTTSLVANGAWANGCLIQAALCGAEFPIRRSRATTLNPLVNHYVARDGRRAFFCLLDQPREWPRLCLALELPDLIEDPRFTSSELRSENSAALVALIDQAMARRDLDDWALVFKHYDLIWSAVPPAAEVARDPQMDAAGVFAEIHPGLKTVQNPVNVEGIEKDPPRMAPKMGEHTREVLRAAGLTEEQIDHMITRGAAAQA